MNDRDLLRYEMFPTINTTNDNECFVPINFRRLILAYKKEIFTS